MKYSIIFKRRQDNVTIDPQLQMRFLRRHVRACKRYRDLRLIVCHSDPLSIHTLPDNLSRYQNIDMDDAGSEKLLLSYFEKKTGNTEKPQPKKQEKEPYVPPSAKYRLPDYLQINWIIALILSMFYVIPGIIYVMSKKRKQKQWYKAKEWEERENRRNNY